MEKLLNVSYFGRESIRGKAIEQKTAITLLGDSIIQ